MSRRRELIEYQQLKVGDIGANLLHNNPNYGSYLQTLMCPFEVQGIKLPTGYPVKSNMVMKRCILNCSFDSGSLTVNGTPYTIDSGSPICFDFIPQVDFDTTYSVQLSYAHSAATIVSPLYNWIDVTPSKGWASNFSQFRCVSAGFRYQYTGAPLYAQGNVAATVTNLADTKSYNEAGSSGYSGDISIFYSDPDTEIFDIMTPVEMVYTPADISCLEFNQVGGVVSGLVDADYCGFLVLSGYSQTNPFSFIIDFIINYEAIPTASFEPISGANESANGNSTESIEIAKKAKEIREWRNKGSKFTKSTGGDYPGKENMQPLNQGIGRYGPHNSYDIGTGTTPIPGVGIGPMRYFNSEWSDFNPYWATGLGRYF